MIFESVNIIKIFMKKIDFSIIAEYLSKNKKDPLKSAVNPQRDWYILLSLFVIFIILIAVYGFFSFLKINNYQDIFVANGSQESYTETINRSELLGVLKEYEQKEKDMEKMKAIRPDFIDPAQ